MKLSTEEIIHRIKELEASGLGDIIVCDFERENGDIIRYAGGQIQYKRTEDRYFSFPIPVSNIKASI